LSTLALARLPVARLVRSRGASLALVGWILFALAMTLLARHANASSVDGTLLGVYLPFVLPLVAYAMVGAAFGGVGIATAVRPLVRFGASPRASALVAGLVATLASAVGCALAAVVLVAAAHDALDPPLARDVALSAYAGALGGAAHGAFFVLGSAATARGGGRSVMLVVNWVFGASPGWISALVPYTHTRSLLGGLPAVTLSEQESAWALVVIIVVSLGLAALRVRR
jgi:hypothetical protein